MTFLIMAFIVTYLAVGTYAMFYMGKDEFKKIPLIFKNEHPLIAVAYTGFLGFIFLFGVITWPLPGFIWLALTVDLLMKKYDKGEK